MSEDAEFVILKKENLVSTQRWRDAVAEHGFALELLDDVDWAKGVGRVRCRYFGDDANFEYTLSPLEGDWLGKMGISRAAIAADADTRVRFSSSTESGSELLPTVGDFYSIAAEYIAAAVLAEVTRGVFVEGFSKLAVGPDMAVGYGRCHEASTMQFVYEQNFGTMLYMPTPREIAPALRSPRLLALFARQAQIFAATFRGWKRSAAQIAELEAIEKELRKIADESETILGTTSLRAWLALGVAKFGQGNEPE
ncbi:MAG TPA: hypothetical protein VKC56_07995 [Gallionellaceae bacterium]|nr:hypothetical protein [Gallionellaceae bacterium]